MITIKKIKKIAELSKLHVDDNELKKLTSEMEKIINFANTINTSYENFSANTNDNEELTNVLRKDEIKPSYNQDFITKNACSAKESFFYLKNLK